MFVPFAKAVHDRYNQLAKNELFVTDIDLWDTYIAAFPEGTNPVYRVRAEHDCSCCRNFIRNLGNVIAIVDGVPQTIWDVKDVPYPYDVVAAVLHDAVLKAPIVGIFRSKEPSYGLESNLQKPDDGTVKKWDHFHGKVHKRHADTQPATTKGAYASVAGVFLRGLTELTPDAFTAVFDLIAEKALYRGEEHLKALREFNTLQTEFLALDEARRPYYVWANAASPAARFRNTVIGTLVTELSEGAELEGAVARFEVKVAPANYKRPTTIITANMVKLAMEKVAMLGIEDALARRFAHIGDVTINNVLWADSSAKAQMKNSLENLLMASIKTTVDEANAIDISIADFMQTVVPSAQKMELFVKNKHSTNFVSLTAPIHADVPNLFKWNNGFAWSYNGNITDSEIRKSVAERGGRVDGVFRFSHSWNYSKRNASLMDLHVFMPGSSKVIGNTVNDSYGNDSRVGWNRRKHDASGGVQDVDYTEAAPVGYVPVENITFPDLARMPEGKYECMVHNWSARTPNEGGFRAEIEFDGQVFEYEVDRPLKNKEWVRVATVTLRAGEFSIEHHLPHQASSQDLWGVKTEAFAKVETLMFSPNYWDDNAVGNKHWFFTLEGCLNPEPARGIYNEFLKGELDPHRKVFEVLGSRTKCEVTDKQLSGLGFSSTQSNCVTVKVSNGKSNKLFNVKFN